MENKPTFIVKMKKNSFGQIGPVLCWPDGGIVERQIDCAVENNIHGLVEVTVTFYATGDFIQIKEYSDGAEEQGEE